MKFENLKDFKIMADFASPRTNEILENVEIIKFNKHSSPYTIAIKFKQFGKYQTICYSNANDFTKDLIFKNLSNIRIETVESQKTEKIEE